MAAKTVKQASSKPDWFSLDLFAFLDQINLAEWLFVLSALKVAETNPEAFMNWMALVFSGYDMNHQLRVLRQVAPSYPVMLDSGMREQDANPIYEPATYNRFFADISPEDYKQMGPLMLALSHELQKDEGRPYWLPTRTNSMIYVNLESPDATIIAAFQKWLETKRRMFPTGISKRGPKSAAKSRITSDTMRAWVDSRMVPIATLKLLAKYHEERFTNRQLAEWVFPDIHQTADPGLVIKTSMDKLKRAKALMPAIEAQVLFDLQPDRGVDPM